MSGRGAHAGIAVVPAGPESAAVIAALLASILEPPWSLDSVTRFLAAPGSFALLAVPESAPAGEPAGFLLARVGADECDLAAMGTARAWRGRGVGRALLEAAFEEAGRRRARVMFLEVAEGNRAAAALYESLGFAEAGRRPGYYRQGGGVGADARLMRRNIEAPPPEKSRGAR